MLMMRMLVVMIMMMMMMIASDGDGDDDDDTNSGGSGSGSGGAACSKPWQRYPQRVSSKNKTDIHAAACSASAYADYTAMLSSTSAGNSVLCCNK